MKNRIIALLIVLTLVLTCLAACGPKAPADNGGNNGDDTTSGNNPGNNNNVPGGDDTTTSTYPWKSTQLIFSISENSDNKQLPSSARRYLAGDLSQIEGAGDKVDQYVADRNGDATKATNVTVDYRYLGEDEKYGWGQSISYINGLVNGDDPEAPDVYINFIYDMVACSLLGNFANLKSEKMYKDGHELAGKEHNYFEFVNPREDTQVDIYGDYVDTGKGYMYEYMRYLTLSKSKMYCLSSDYFIDMVRAFFAIPVNVEMLETYVGEASQVEGAYNYDYEETWENGVKETNYTIEDLYGLVYAGKWNYQTLAAFSEAVSTDADKITAEGDSSTVRFGFVLGTDSGLPAAGMLYTTPIQIVNRTMDITTGEYTYDYPNMQRNNDGTHSFYEDPTNPNSTFESLIDFCDRLGVLMNAKGVITANQTTDGVHSATSIRTAFSQGKVLFGGVIVIGGLENEEYVAMNGEGKSGYGILPVPLYKETLTEEDYLTQVHNNGKIGAIAFNTTKFAQCTAYLDYQSTHSNNILEGYYGYTLSNLVDEGGIDNTEMLKMLRSNVRSSFDKAYEDVIGKYYESQTNGKSIEDEWHNIIKNANFGETKAINIRETYASVAGAKANRLYDIEHDIFPGLPQ